MRHIQICLMFILPLAIAGQTFTTEHLKNEIETGILNIKDQSFDEAVLIFQETIDKSKSINYDKGLARSYLYLAEALLDGTTKEIAIDYLDSAKHLAKYLSEYELAYLHENYGHYYNYKSAFVKAISAYEEALTFYADNDLFSEVISIYADLATVYTNKGDLFQAGDLYEKAYLMILEHEINDEIGRVFRGLSTIYRSYKNIEEAKKFGWKALELFQDHHELNGLKVNAYNNLGHLYYSQGRYDSAILLFKQSLIHASHDIATSTVLANISSIYLKIQMLDSAEKYIKKGVELMRSKYPSYEFVFHKYMARMLLLQNKLDSAEFYAKSYLREKTHSDYDEDIYSFLIDLLRKKGETDSAIYYYDKFLLYKDSVHLKTQSEDFASYRVRIETMEKQKQIESLEAEAKLTELLNVGITIGALMVIVILGVSYRLRITESKRKRLKAELERNNYKLELDRHQRELSDFTLAMIRKNQLLEELQEQARDALRRNSNNWAAIVKTIERNMTSEKDWQDFNKYFGVVHNDFFEKLCEKHPLLSKNELRHAALIRMNLTLKESAEIMGVAPKSIKMARFRMKKKLNLETEDSLRNVIQEI